MALSISRGAKPSAQKVVIYGVEGIGKTLFASQFPNVLFIDTEGGTTGYDVARIDPAPASWNALIKCVKDVKVERPCSTLVLDTADWAEILCAEHICAKNNWESIETPNYGAGYTALKEEYGKLLNYLSDVVGAGINVVITAHAMMRKFERPDEAAGYDRFELKLQKKTAALVKEWADALLFADYETVVETVKGDMGKTKGKARGGKRVMHTQHHACWDAKNRWGLPDKVPFEYAQIAPYISVMSACASTPAVTQVATPAPVVEPVAEAPAQVAPLPVLPDYWKPLLQLMEGEKVDLQEVQDVVVKKGYYTYDTPAANYDRGFVEGVLIGAWPQVLEQIKQNVPFSK